MTRAAGWANGLGVYLDFADAIERLGEAGVRERYGNLFDIYHEITDENAYRVPMRIFPAVHYTMGGLWVDYNLMSNVPGLFVLGEANFSDHGANRLGASALMQGLADGYFVIPYTIGDYLAAQKPGSRPTTDAPEFQQAEENVRGIGAPPGRQGPRAGQPFPQAPRPHPVGSLRHGAQRRPAWSRPCGKSRAARGVLAERQCPGDGGTLNQSLERAGRVADFLELAELLCRDALAREESCGGHFREEHQYPDGECLRDDEASPMWPPGSTRARAGRRCRTRSPWTTRSSRWPSATTSKE